jgi:sporulation protein YlmC with PRC-barrel domain
MFIDVNTLMSLPVYTQSGTKLGLIKNIELDVDTQHVRAYEVEPKFFGKISYRVMPSQIKSISANKVVVDDSLITDKYVEEKIVPQTTAPSLGGVVSLQEE